MACSPKLIVTQDDRGRFECVREGECGACIAGHGSSVLEAVGSWAIYSQTVVIRCNPPSVLREFGITNDYGELSFTKAPKRG